MVEVAGRERPAWRAVAGRAVGAGVWLYLMLAVAAVAGVYARFSGLGERTLAIDEYYSLVSIQLILEHGLPRFDEGGYYFRGPLFQYLTALSMALLGGDGFAQRLPQVLFSLLGAALGYVYAREHTSRPLALAVASVLLLSSWQIEFARFIRFYAAFQVTFLLFLILLQRSFFAERARLSVFAPHLGLLLVATCHELALLMLPLLFLPFLPDATRVPRMAPDQALRYLAVTALTAVLIYLMVMVDLRNWGVDDALPLDYVRPGYGLGLPITVPSTPFFLGAVDPLLKLVLIAGLCAAPVLCFLFLKIPGEPVDMLAWVALIAACLHQFVVLGLALILLLGRYDLVKIRGQPRGRLVLVGTALAVALFWLVWTLSHPGALSTPEAARSWTMEGGGLAVVVKGVWAALFGWPELYRATLRPLAVDAPGLALIFALGLIWFASSQLKRPLAELFGHPAFLLVYTALVLGCFVVASSATRYWFPLHTTILLLAALALGWLVRRLGQGRAGPAWIRAETAAPLAGLALIAANILAGDIDPRHLLQAGGEPAAYRTGPFAGRANHWYPREDHRTPARIVADGFEPETDLIVAANLPQMPAYLTVPHLVYLERDGQRFERVSRRRGSVDLWSGRPLISTPDQLRNEARNKSRLWLLQSADPRWQIVDPAWLGGRLKTVQKSSPGFDQGIEILRIDLAPPQP
ncbi:MAG: ArnT family glycosyltransferase [Geminicoccaceae bacterium]